MGFIEMYREQIRQLCRNLKVKSLYSFGSVNTSKFNKESDVDLMVDFITDDPIEYSENYFDLKFALEKILNRHIDLLENRGIKNPFLRDTINKSKVLICEH